MSPLKPKAEFMINDNKDDQKGFSQKIKLENQMFDLTTLFKHFP